MGILLPKWAFLFNFLRSFSVLIMDFATISCYEIRMKNLQDRNGFWYLRRSVPGPLQSTFGGKKDIWRSLGTKDRKEAERRFHSAMAKLNAEFEAAERQLHAAEEEAAHLASKRMNEALERFGKLAHRMELPFGSFAPAASSPEDKAAIEMALMLGQAQPRPASRAQAVQMIDKALAQLEWEREHGVTLSLGTDEDGEPNWAVPVRYLDALTAWFDERFEADKRTLEALRAEFEGGDEAGSQLWSRGRQDHERTATGTLRGLAEVWKTQRSPALSTQNDMRTALARFEALNGPLPYQGVTVEHLRRFKDDLLRDTAIKSATKQKLWTMVRSLLTVAKEDGLLATNPFEQVKLGRLKDDAESREVLTRDDLIKIFSSLEGDEWWLVRMALYTGARLGELCQLREENIIRETGAIFLHITDDPEMGKTVKTRNSVRRVPVHRQLIADGFEEWLASRSDLQLFPFTSSVASKRLNRRFKAAGIGEGKVVHSLRHTFIGAARQVMEEDYRERITGHKSQRVSRTYGDYADLKAKIDLVRFGTESSSND